MTWTDIAALVGALGGLAWIGKLISGLVAWRKVRSELHLIDGEALREAIATLQQENARLCERLEELDRDYAQLRQKLRGAQAELERLSEHNEQLGDRIEELRSSLDEAESSLAEARDEIRALRSENEQLRDRVSELERENRELRGV